MLRWSVRLRRGGWRRRGGIGWAVEEGADKPKDLMLMGGGGGVASLNKAASTSSMDARGRERRERAAL